MKSMMITLKSIEDVKLFINEVNKLSCDADLTSGRYVIDAKSIMGIFSLDLANSIKLDVHCKEEDVASVDAFFSAIAKFESK